MPQNTQRKTKKHMSRHTRNTGRHQGGLPFRELRTKWTRLLPVQASLNVTVQYLRHGGCWGGGTSWNRCWMWNQQREASAKLPGKFRCSRPYTASSAPLWALQTNWKGPRCVSIFLFSFPLLCFCVLAIMRNNRFWTFTSLSRILTWWITMLLRINLSAHPPPPAPSSNPHMEKKIPQWD